MDKKIQLIIAVIGLASALGPAIIKYWNGTTPIPQTEKLVFQGIIKNGSTRSPISRVEIVLTNHPSRLLLKSDANGLFSFKVEADKNFKAMLEFKHPSYARKAKTIRSTFNHMIFLNPKITPSLNGDQEDPEEVFNDTLILVHKPILPVEVEADAPNASIKVVIELLDGDADIFVDGEWQRRTRQHTFYGVKDRTYIILLKRGGYEDLQKVIRVTGSDDKYVYRLEKKK